MSRLPFVGLIALATACGGSGGSSTLVDPPASAVASVVIPSGNLSLTPGSTRRLSAEVRAANGASMPGTLIAWTTSAPAVATVSADGTVTAIDGGTATITATAGGRSASVSATVDAVYDLATRGVPRIIESNYIDLTKIARITRFRSGFGHDYSDVAERCRSMKHYFMPRSGLDWGTVVISSPVNGTIAEIRSETTFGEQIRIVSGAVPAASVIIFHVRRDASVAVDMPVVAGQRIGTHIGTQTMSDVAIRVRATEGMRMVSYFEAMTDGLFQAFDARGITSRDSMIISAAERDASPLTCDGEQFQGPGLLENWVDLK